MYVKESAKIRRTFRKIECWKVVRWDSERGIYTAPIYDSDSYIEGNKLKSDKRIKIGYKIVTHGLHTYVTETDALDGLERFSKASCGELRLVKCRIPMFSRYIEGTDENGLRCYVSEKLKVVKFV